MFFLLSIFQAHLSKFPEDQVFYIQDICSYFKYGNTGNIPGFRFFKKESEFKNKKGLKKPKKGLFPFRNTSNLNF